MIVHGHYHNGVDTRKHQATIILAANGSYKIIWAEGEHAGTLKTARITTRLGNIPRRLHLDNGAQFVTQDNEAVDRAITSAGLARKPSLIHKLEQSPGIAVTALVLLAVSLLSFFKYGMPILAERAVAIIPAEVERTIAIQSLEFLDRFLLAPTELDEESQHQLRVEFNEILSAHLPDQNITIIFRKGQSLGANAFALPGGYIIFTDELVYLVDNFEELSAVLGHELGHVVNRHAMRRIMENSAITLVMFSLTSDTNTIIQAASALPVMLISSKYAREYETEADRYSLDFLSRAGIDTEYYASILRKLQDGREEGNMTGFLATHPPTEERIKLIEGGSEKQ